MRIVCVQPAREPVVCGKSSASIGSAPDNDVVCSASGCTARHAMLTEVPGGFRLDVLPGSARVYVNARAVQERALLRYGDTLTLGANRLLLTPDTPPPETPLDGAMASSAPIVLRCVSGTQAGCALVAAGELRLGAGTRHFSNLPHGFRVGRDGQGAFLETHGAAVQVNGWPCTSARLAPGDQIAAGAQRFLFEAPGAVQQAEPVAPPPRMAEETAATGSASTGIWWLIGAAVVLAAAIAAFLYFHG